MAQGHKTSRWDRINSEKREKGQQQRHFRHFMVTSELNRSDDLGPQMGSVETGSFGDWAPEEFFGPSGQDLKLGKGRSPPTLQKNKNKNWDPLFKTDGKVVWRAPSGISSREVPSVLMNYRTTYYYTSLYLDQVRPRWVLGSHPQLLGNIGNSLGEPFSEDTDCEGHQRYSGRSLVSEVGRTRD